MSHVTDIIERVRNIFSKGFLVINDKGITVFYNHKDRWIEQEFPGEKVRDFADLVRNSDDIIIEHKTGKHAKFVFHIDFADQNPVVFQPLEEQLSSEDLHKIMDNLREESRSNPKAQAAEERFFGFFADVDFDDDDAVFEKLKEWVNKIDNERKSNYTNLDEFKRWRILLNKATLLAGFLNCECEVLENESGGWVTIYLPEGTQNSIRISGKTKELLLMLLEVTGFMNIEVSVKDGFINIGFCS